MLLIKKVKNVRRFLNSVDLVEISRENHILYTYKTYVVLVLIRLGLILIPLVSYVHPSEYQQMLEVVAGRVLGVEHTIPREYDSRNPTRSTSLAFLTFGTPLFILRFTDYTLRHFFNISILSPYTILLTIRLILFLLSLTVDYTIYLTCKLYYRPFLNKLIVFATAYTTLVYSTHPLIGTIELPIYAMLLYLTSKSMLAYDQACTAQQLFLEDKSTDKLSIEKKIEYARIVKRIQNLNMQHCLTITTLVVMGIFTRPSFLVYCIIPLFFWIHRGLSANLTENFNWMDVHLRMGAIVLSSIPAVLVLTLYDSFYYGYLTIAEIFSGDITINNFVSIHSNFLRWLAASSITQSLRELVVPHVIDIFFTLSIMYTVLFLAGFAVVANMLYRLSKRRRFSGYDRVMHIDNFLLMNIAIPVTCFILIPQLNEFSSLQSLVFPLVILYGDHVIKLHKFLKAIDCTWDDIKQKWEQMGFGTTTKYDHKILFRIYLFINFIAAIFFGCVFQGGVFQLAWYLSRVTSESKNITYVITAYTYNLPKVLLNIPNSNQLYRSREGYLYKKRTLLNIYNLGNRNFESIHKHVSALANLGENRADDDFEVVKRDVLLVLPGILANDYINYVQCNSDFNSSNILQVEIKKTLFINFSLEAMLKSMSKLLRLSLSDVLHVYDGCSQVFDLFTIKVLHIRLI